MQVSGDGFEADKETGEQEDRDGGNWAHKCGHLEGREGDRAITGVIDPTWGLTLGTVLLTSTGFGGKVEAGSSARGLAFSRQLAT